MIQEKLPCPNGCKDPHGRMIYMTGGHSRWDIVSKKEKATLQCPMCRRWTFDR